MPHGSENLLAQVSRKGGGGEPELTLDGEAMWLDVIAKMDEVYSDLLRYETDLEQKNAELESAQAFISSVIESVSDVLIVVDGDGRILQVNPAFLKLTGDAETQLVGAALVDVLTADHREVVRSMLADSNEMKDCELRFLTRNGPSDLMAMACSARLDAQGRKVGAVLTGRPIGELRRAYEALHRAHTELQQAQKKLVEQEKMASLGRLVAGVAHELNNPISFVYGNIHTLERYRRLLHRYLDQVHAGQGGQDREQLRRDLKIDAILQDLEPLIEGTLEGAVRIADIVKNLRRLSYSRSDGLKPVILEKVVRTAAHWSAKARKSPAEIEILADADVQVSGHEGQLHQVLVNLVENAMDAVSGRADGKLMLAVRREGAEALVEVADNGPGIATGAADKIFEPFFTTKTVGEGTGLGLWISYAIAREHGGDLVLAESALGARFQLRLPALPPSPAET